MILASIRLRAKRTRKSKKENADITDHKCTSRFEENVTLKMNVKRGKHFVVRMPMKITAGRKNDDDFESMVLL